MLLDMINSFIKVRKIKVKVWKSIWGKGSQDERKKFLIWERNIFSQGNFFPQWGKENSGRGTECPAAWWKYIYISSIWSICWHLVKKSIKRLIHVIRCRIHDRALKWIKILCKSVFLVKDSFRNIAAINYPAF